MSDLDFSLRSDAPTGGGSSLCTAEDIIARAQRLIEAPRPAGGHPLAWYVEASNVGDLTTIAVAALRGAGISSPGQAS